MLLYIPILCPTCLEKVFFFQKINQNFGVADLIDSQIHYHICPFITGQNYWQTTILKKCFSFIEQKHQDLTKIFLANKPPFYFSKTSKVSKRAILLKYEHKESIDRLCFINFDFVIFYLFAKPQEKWDVGKIFKIAIKTIVKNKGNFATNLELVTEKKAISLENINNNIFLMELRGANLNLLEKSESIVLKQLHKKKIRQQTNKMIAVYPQNSKSGFTRKIVFFLSEQASSFFASFSLPHGVTFTLLQNELLFALEDLKH